MADLLGSNLKSQKDQSLITNHCLYPPLPGRERVYSRGNGKWKEDGGRRMKQRYLFFLLPSSFSIHPSGTRNPISFIWNKIGFLVVYSYIGRCH
jgi:hypothetical protein